MTLPRGLFCLLCFMICAGAGRAQKPEPSLTAQQIVQRAIDSCGGDSLLTANASVEYITQVLTPDNDSVSIAIKKSGFNKNYISILSQTHVNSTRIFNQGKAVEIINDTVRELYDPATLEDLLLQCYVLVSQGYQKLGYQLSRQSDQKFDHFECYVVKATSPMGKQTMNYYDKKKGDLLMIIYSNGAKTIFTDYIRQNGIRIPSGLLLSDPSNQVSVSILQKLNYDKEPDGQWFEIPPAGIRSTTDRFRKGQFIYKNSNPGSKLVRTENKQIEKDGQRTVTYNIDWQDNTNYLLFRVKNPNLPPINENMEFIKVRIITWKNNIYYCQYLTTDGTGDTCAFEKTGE